MWAHSKNKQQRVKKLERKREKMIKQMNKIRKQEMADKGFKTWLKMSLLKAKQENNYKRVMKKQKKLEKQEQRRLQERK